MPGEQWQIAAALGNVYAEQRDAAQAQQASARAATIIQALAQDLADRTLRESFLAAATRMISLTPEL